MFKRVQCVTQSHTVFKKKLTTQRHIPVTSFTKRQVVKYLEPGRQNQIIIPTVILICLMDAEVANQK